MFSKLLLYSNTVSVWFGFVNRESQCSFHSALILQTTNGFDPISLKIFQTWLIPTLFCSDELDFQLIESGPNFTCLH